MENKPPVEFNIDNNSPPTPRRGTRQKKTPLKFDEFLLNNTPRKNRKLYESDSEDELTEKRNSVTPKKISDLFENDDVEGQDLFKFKARHTPLGLQNMAQLAIRNTSKTPESSSKRLRKISTSYATNIPRNNTTEATPKHVRKLIKKRIICEVESDSSGKDFSASSSDFVPEESEHESNSSDNSTESDVEETEIPKKTDRGQVARKLRSKQEIPDVYYAPDNYFMKNSSKKITTSNHTLERLKKLKINDKELNERTDTDFSDEHKSKIQELLQSYEQLFDKWLYFLNESFNIVLYGCGSKYKILEEFQAQKLPHDPCIVINGFFPSLTLKSILEAIVINMLHCTHVPKDARDIIKLISKKLSEADTHLYLIIHNIDGRMLRNSKAQEMLASISQIKQVHTIASVDHINAPLLWDHSKVRKFNFLWWDTTTFLPYTEETSYEDTLKSQKSGELQLSSLRTVYQCLTTNARGIFNIIIRNQLDNQKQSHYQGLPFKDLYLKSREEFLASSDVALRAHLTEFLDHKLVKMKRTVDGSENLIIPIQNTLLQQFMEQQDLS